MKAFFSRRPGCRLMAWTLALMMGAAGAQEPTPAGTGTAEARFGLQFEPVEFTPPELGHATLANGIPLVHYREDEPGLVTILVQLRAGTIQDPAGKVGVASLTADIIRTGGSTSTPGDELDLLLDKRGAQMGAESDRERTTFRLSVLPEDAEWGMALLHEVLTDPALPVEKLEEAVGRRLVGLRQRLDVPSSIARAMYPQLIYGKDNPWGWTETARTLGAIGVEDLRQFHAENYRPGLMMLGVSGAIELERARELADATFGAIAKRDEPAVQPLPAVEPVRQSRVVIVPRPLTQNVIYAGHEGVGRLEPDKFPIKIFNAVLSGGFTSRLFREVRSERGLAYSVYGILGEGTVRGIFFNVAQTKVESSWEVLELMLSINRDLQRESPSAEEMELARQAEVNSFVFFFDTAEKMVRQQLMLDSFGYPEDYLETYVDNLLRVEPEMVREAAERRLSLNSIVVLIVGAVDEELRARLEREIGPVSEISDEELRAEWL